MTKSINAGTKLVQVRLSALTRVEYMEVVSVPADITPEELQALVNSRYDKVDGGEFVSDPEYWERGECYAVDAESNDQPELQATRAAAGGLEIKPLAQVEEEHIPSDLEDEVQGLAEFFSVPEVVRADVIRRFLEGQPTPEIPGARLDQSDIIVTGVVTAYGKTHETEVNLRTGELPTLLGVDPSRLEGQEEEESFLLQVGEIKGQVFCGPTWVNLEKTTTWTVQRGTRKHLRKQILGSHGFRFGIVTLTEEVGPNGTDLGVGSDWLDEDFTGSRQDAVRMAKYIYTHKLVDGTVVVVDRGIVEDKPKLKIVFQLSRKA